MRKKILHVITGLGDGGAEGVLTRLCLNSKAADHVVVSLTDEGKYGPVLREHNVKVECLGMNPGRPGIGRFIRLIRFIRAEKPDVVQTWMYHADLLGGLAARIAGVKRVFWGVRHSTLNGDTAKKSTIFVARLCARLSWLLPEKVICCANKAKQVHVELGYCENKMLVIPNGYDLGRFRLNRHAREKERNEFNVKQDEIFLGVVGRFHPQKDHGNLLAALSLLKDSGYPFRCVLVGTGMCEANQTLMGLVERFGLQNVIFLAGPRADIPQVMNALDVHVLSSSSEGFPNVVAEAMACETPCVATDVGDAALIVGDTGVISPPRQPDALARAIACLLDEKLSDVQLWESRCRRSRARISECYSLESAVRMYEQAWNLSE